MAYSNYASITVDNTKVSGTANHSNFPVLVRGTYDGTGGEPDLRTAANGGNVQNTDATGGADGATTVPADFAFYDDSSATTQYKHEVVEYDATTGDIYAYVKIPTLDYDDDTTFYMHYNDSGVTTSQEDINNVWTDYDIVTHDMINDSTSNNKDFTNVGTDASSGKLSFSAKAKTFVEANSDSTYLEDAIFNISGSTTFQVSFWMYFNSLPDDQIVLYACGAVPDGNGAYYGVQMDETDEFWGQVYDGGQVLTGTQAITIETWYYITMTLDGDLINLSVNGSAKATGDYSNAVAGSAGWQWGNVNGVNRDHPDAIMEGAKFIINDTVHNDDWHTTEYNNQNSPSTFYTMGAEEGGTRRYYAPGIWR